MYYLRNSTKLLILAAVILWAAFSGYYYLKITRPPLVETPDTPESIATEAEPVEVVDDAVNSYARALEAEARGDYQSAVKYYEASLPDASNIKTEARIEYKIARLTDNIDPVESIRRLKAILDEPSYPDIQKKYAAVWIAQQIMKNYGEHPGVLAAATEGVPYNTFPAETPAEAMTAFYEYSLQFGSTGMAEFAMVKKLAEDIRDGVISGPNEIASAKSQILEYREAGDRYIENNQTDPVNVKMIPRILREKARAVATLAQIDDLYGLENIHSVYENAILNGLASRLDGAIRWDYFRYAYKALGAESFTQTGQHIEFLMRRIDEYPGMKTYFIKEANDHYGGKADVVEYANAYPSFKQFLIAEMGWQVSDF